MSSQPRQESTVAIRDKLYKRPLDLVILLTAHIILLPLWLLLWTAIPLAIWLQDRGPVFFKQYRMGKGGKEFKVLKFRTMVVNADKIGPSWNTPNDRRVTTLGRVLRKTALDELPQILNIAKGEMSFVGPRSLDVDEHRILETEIQGFKQRLAVRPGLTGLAQLYDTTDVAATKLHYDLEYIRRMSLWLDVRIILLSAWTTLVAQWDRRSGKPPSQTTATQ